MLVELCSPWLSDWNLFVLIIELWLSYARHGLVIEFCSIGVDIKNGNRIVVVFRFFCPLFVQNQEVSQPDVTWANL